MVDVTASLNEPVHDDSMPFFGRDADRCRSILLLKIDVTASMDELLRDGRMPFFGCDEER